jgi:maleylacetoacetate isomerase
MKLFSYWRSSAAYRVRIALNLKKIDCELVPVHLLRDGGEHRQAAYLDLNPQGLVPALEHNGAVIGQSLAIIEYLESRFPEPPLLPDEPVICARVRAIAQSVACDIAPLNNLRVMNYLRTEMGQDAAAVDRWYGHWVARGFQGLETQIGRYGNGRYCCGDAVTLADVLLVPQVYNARRFNCDLEPYPQLLAVAHHLNTLEAFRRAAPENQPDAEL